MNIKGIIYSKFGQIIISILLGLGLATLFRRACNERNCLVFKGPEISKIKNQVFKYNDKCYSFEEKAKTCDASKKMISF